MPTLFLCGDVMTGRGIDQILPRPSPPEIHEPYVQNAREYVELAERASGSITRPVGPAYVWGDALGEIEGVAPDAGVINLETSVTRSDEYWRGKEIHYRMHPDNVACLSVPGIDVCALANNHVLDYGYAGLEETLETLAGAGLKTAGAGRVLAAARRPAVVELGGGGRLLVFAAGAESSGIPPAWAATDVRAGVEFLPDLSEATAGELVARVRALKRPGDLVVASIHWGGNWGYEVPASQVRFAHWLIEGGVDLVHGHSSHHPRPIEVYREKLVLYGCGDFIDDYEGIGGYEEVRGDLVLMYFPSVAPLTGTLAGLRMTPMRIRRMRLQKASPAEAEWLRDQLTRICGEFGSQAELDADGSLALRWETRGQADLSP